MKIARLKKSSYPSIAIRRLTCDKNNVYPESPVHTYNCSYIAYNGDPHLTTCLYGDINDRFLHGDELGWLLKQEVRMIASINLALKDGEYRFLAYEPFEMIPQGEVASVVDCENFVLKKFVHDLLDTHYRKTDVFGTDKQEYILEDYEYGVHRPEYIYNLIVGSGEVLTRCLSLWVKSVMLFQNPAFREEATSLMYFALDGLVKLHQQRFSLKHQGINLKGTFDRLIEVLPVYGGMAEYAATCHENRTMFVHPVNDFDEAWSVPLLADDYYETVDLFRALVTAYLMPRELGLG